MKRKRVRFETVLMDGGIRLAPGEWLFLHEDTPFEPHQAQLVAWIGRVRGGVLSSIFAVENDLIQLYLANEFGTVDHGKAPAAFFNRDQELREDHSLGRKIDNVKALIRNLFPNGRADCLIQDLATCREIRNLMAHYPCWIEPVNNVIINRTTGMKLFIADRHHIWELEEDDVRIWIATFVRVQRELITLRHRLTGLPEPDWIDEVSAVIKSPDVQEPPPEPLSSS